MRFLSPRFLIILFLLALPLLYIGWVYTAPYTTSPPYRTIDTLATYSENGVDVEVRLERDGNDHALLATTFTPQMAGFHLYGNTMPPEGIEGLGRPTLVSLESTSLQLEGALFADATEEIQKVGDLEIPIYPERAITLRMPVSWSHATPTATLYLTYMACSDTQGCLLPVEKQPISISLGVEE